MTMAFGVKLDENTPKKRLAKLASLFLHEQRLVIFAALRS